jgi:hypothetical protein
MDISEDVKGPYASSPADIRATAENIAENYSFDPSILAGAICAALVSERERRFNGALTPSMLRAGLTAMRRDDLEPTETEFTAGYTAAIRDALGETFGAITGITPGFTAEQVEAINRRPTPSKEQ